MSARPSLKRHVGQVIRNHYRSAIIMLAIAAILFALAWMLLVPVFGWTPGLRESLAPHHFPFPLMGLGFVAGAAILFVRARRLSRRPEQHPVLQGLSVYGPPMEVMAEIDDELSGEETVRIGRPLRSFRIAWGGEGPPVYLTRSWLVQFTETGLHLVRLDDMLWVWKCVSASFHTVRVLVRRGEHAMFLLPADEVERLLLWLLRRAPWVRVGYDPLLDQLCQIRPEQLGALVGEVAQERQALEQRPEERETAIQTKAQGFARAEHRQDRQDET